MRIKRKIAKNNSNFFAVSSMVAKLPVCLSLHFVFILSEQLLSTEYPVSGGLNFFSFIFNGILLGGRVVFAYTYVAVILTFLID